MRTELDNATQKGDKLLVDVNVLTENWEKLNEELLQKEKQVRKQLFNIFISVLGIEKKSIRGDPNFLFHG